MTEQAYGGGGLPAWLYISLQDNDLRLTLPWLLFPLAAHCGIGYQGGQETDGIGRGGMWLGG